jgi:hypothetical protein
MFYLYQIFAELRTYAGATRVQLYEAFEKIDETPPPMLEGDD